MVVDVLIICCHTVLPTCRKTEWHTSKDSYLVPEAVEFSWPGLGLPKSLGLLWLWLSHLGWLGWPESALCPGQHLAGRSRHVLMAEWKNKNEKKQLHKHLSSLRLCWWASIIRVQKKSHGQVQSQSMRALKKWQGQDLDTENGKGLGP